MRATFVEGKGPMQPENPSWNDRPISVAGVFVIRVNGVSQPGSEIRGDVLNTRLSNLGRFRSYFQLFTEIQTALDQLGLPQRSSDRRSLLHKPLMHGRKLPPVPEPEALPFDYDPISPEIRGRVRNGRYALFFLRVISRQNATWQGHLYWADQRLGGYFRSVMELFELMDEVIRVIQDNQGEPPVQEPPDGGEQIRVDGEVAYGP